MNYQHADLEAWPPLPYEAWQDTLDTLHMWTQIVGKVKLELSPFLNEFWQVAFHLTARGLSTGLIPYRERAFEVDFDFVHHNLHIRSDDDRAKSLPLMRQSVADFYREFMAALGALGIAVRINTLPVEVPNPIACDTNHALASYDPEPVTRWWRILLQTARVLNQYRASFVGKSSPINFFWGSFDLNETRFSGRAAPPPKGPRFYQLSEDQENVACGFWPGNPNMAGLTPGGPAFYSYVYPEPAGYRDFRPVPEAARYHPQLGEFVLPYEAVRQLASPERTLLQFFQSTYEAAASLGAWDRSALERIPPSRSS
ncbi:MAG: hypothetical protein JO023_13820 [Chloroflexi bacterium]|nr:hypothetical protein [Chloroflexota bacterium]